MLKPSVSLRNVLVGSLLLSGSYLASPLVAADAAKEAKQAAVAAGKSLAQTDAQRVVNQSTQDMLALIASAQDYAKQDPERFYREVEALLAPAVDFRAFSRNVMAASYKRATPEQRERFAESFKWGLVRTYALALTEFSGGEINLVPDTRPSSNPKRERVKMEIKTSAGDTYPVVYSLRLNKAGNWVVYNLVVNGVNMGLTFRSQFKSAVNDKQYQGDLDKVIDAWATGLEDTGPADA